MIGQGLLVAAVLALACGIAVADPIRDPTPRIDPSPASLPSGPVIPASEPASVPAAERPPGDGMRLSPRVDAVLVAKYTLPAEQAGVTLEQGLRAAGFAQLAVVLVP